MAGSRLARATPAVGLGPLRCCITDGGLAVAGSEAGVLQLWDVALMSASGAHVGGRAVAPAPDGLYPPWVLPSGQAINGVSAAAGGGRAGESCTIALANDDGSVALLTI